MKELLNLLLHPAFWLSSHANRVRLRGARVEVIALVLCRNPEPAILLGQVFYNKLWLPPQEGVNLKESFQPALRRCLQVECGFELPEDETAFARLLHIRSIRHVGILPLPPNRHGERLVADDANGTPLEHVRLTKKAYWAANILIANRDDVRLQPDGKELVALKWFSLAEARTAIVETNTPEKAALLERCLAAAAQDIFGAPRLAR